MQRKGSCSAFLNVFHSDIELFLETKKENADERLRLKTLSIGVTIPDKFMEILESDKPLFLFKPYSVFKEYGMHMDDMNMDEWYDKLVENKNVKKVKANARLIFQKIAEVQQESGYPYLFFVDNANKYNALKKVGRIYMTNLCTEIMQHQTPSKFTGLYEPGSEFGKDVSCNLATINVANTMKHKNIKDTVRLGMDALNTVAKQTSLSVTPTIKNGNDSSRSVGLGSLNLHGFLASNRIMYESREAKDFVNVFYMMKNFYSLERSSEIAVEDKFIFEGFEKSEYADGKYFEKYIANNIAPVTDKVKSLFEGIYIPNSDDWKELSEKVQKNGLAHAYRLAEPPTGNVSYVQNATAGVMPITEQVETRKYGDSTTQYPMPGMTNENMFYYKSAYEMDMFKFIDLIAIIQQHVDQGISATIFVNSDKTTADLNKYHIYAHKKKLKSLYYLRTNLLSVDECLSCQA